MLRHGLGVVCLRDERPDLIKPELWARLGCCIGYRICRLAAAVWGQCDEDRAAERAVVPRPGLASAVSRSRRSKLPRSPLSLSIVCTSSASRVAGTHRAAVLEAAVVGEDDVQQRLGELGREAGDLLDRAPDGVVAAGDLADQLAGVVQGDAALVAGVGVELADVVQQRAADGEVAVDAREDLGGGGGRVGDLQRVLEQPGAVGVVVVLGGERAAERAPGVRLGAEEPLHQRGEVGLGEAGDVRVEPALELGDRGGRRVEQPLPVDLERGENALDGELAARSAGALRTCRSPGPARRPSRSRPRRSTSSHTTAGTTPVRSASAEPHVVGAGPGAADLALADEQHLVDGAAVSQVADIADRWGRG